MPVQIEIHMQANVREAARHHIASGVGEREGDWSITVKDEAAHSAWDVSVRGPNGFHWAKRFRGAERDLEHIGQSVRAAIDMAAVELSTALAQLAKAGIAYTTDRNPDGTTIYVIDRVRLREEELVLLKNAGALTREGIRQYLTDRAA